MVKNSEYDNKQEVLDVFTLAQRCAVTVVKKLLGFYSEQFPDLLVDKTSVIEMLEHIKFDASYTDLYTIRSSIQLNSNLKDELLSEMVSEEISEIINLGLSLGNVEPTIALEVVYPGWELKIVISKGKVDLLLWEEVSNDY